MFESSQVLELSPELVSRIEQAACVRRCLRASSTELLALQAVELTLSAELDSFLADLTEF